MSASNCTVRPIRMFASIQRDRARRRPRTSVPWLAASSSAAFEGCSTSSTPLSAATTAPPPPPPPSAPSDRIAAPTAHARSDETTSTPSGPSVARRTSRSAAHSAPSPPPDNLRPLSRPLDET
eukprot:1686819-Pleurochrysis_carterae.AAC.1